jgi:hypothetical protein
VHLPYNASFFLLVRHAHLRFTDAGYETKNKALVFKKAPMLVDTGPQDAFACFPWEGSGEAAEASLRLANLNSISGLWVVGNVPSSLMPGSGEIRAGV